MTPLFYLFGHYRVSLPACRAEELFLALDRLSLGEGCAEIRTDGERLSFYCRPKVYAVLSELFPEMEITERRGIPRLLRRLSGRYGMIVGLFAFVLILFFSERYIWDIRVEGAVRLDEKSVIELLAREGFEVGTAKRDIDVDYLENSVLIATDEISWISVNINGTVARVEIRESQPPADEEERMDAANLVAERNGVVWLFENVRGNIVTEIGEAVSEGELLVSGLYDSERVGMRYTVAKGKVFAVTERQFSAEIPLEYEEKVPTGREWSEKYLKFFKKEVKFFSNYRNSGASCDTIMVVESEEEYSTPKLPENAVLPVGIRTVRYIEKEIVTRRRSESEAEALARESLAALIREAIGEDGELLSVSYTAECADGVYYLRCDAECVEDIAVTQEIEIELAGE